MFSSLIGLLLLLDRLVLFGVFTSDAFSVPFPSSIFRFRNCTIHLYEQCFLEKTSRKVSSLSSRLRLLPSPFPVAAVPSFKDSHLCTVSGEYNSKVVFKCSGILIMVWYMFSRVSSSPYRILGCCFPEEMHSQDPRNPEELRLCLSA